MASPACGGGEKKAPAATPPPAAVAKPAAPPPSVDGHRTVIDLIDNRVHASTYAAGWLVVDAGGLDFLKYIDGGWKTSWIIDDKDPERAAAFVSGVSSVMFVPVDGAADGAAGPTAGAAARLKLSIKSLAPKQRLSVFVNEKALPTIDVADGWSEHDLPIAAGILVAGDNRIRLTFRAMGKTPKGKKSAAAIARVAIGGAEATALPAEVRVGAVQADATLGGAKRRALACGGAAGGRLSYYVALPRGAKLALAYGSEAPGARVKVRVAADGMPPQTLHEGAAQGTWTEAVVDLGRFGEHAARVDLIADGGRVLWAEPRVMVVGAAPPSPPAKKFERVYVWMVDTFRADKMRGYNPASRVETPNFDAFAKDATRFAWATVPGTWSLPSHASLLTGVYPTVHKAVAHEAKVSTKVSFAAELFKKAGYKTAIFSSNGYVSSKWGFERGWDHSRNFIRESLPNGADYLWKTAKEWVTKNSGKPQFVYYATVDPHVIYNPKKEFLEKYWTKPYTGPIKPTLTGIQLGKIKAGTLKPNDTDKAYLEALYDAEVTQADAAFGVFIADLKAAGTYDTTAIVVVSDHGDEFWDHGDVGHAQSVYQELVHVPLMIRAPGVFEPGRVVHADVEIMDLGPTLCDLGGITPPTMQGASLVAVAADDTAHRPSPALSINNGISRGLKVERWKLVHVGLGRIELYDALDDRGETKNVAAERPIALRQMRSVFGLLYAHEERWLKASWGTAANLSPRAFEPPATPIVSATP